MITSRYSTSIRGRSYSRPQPTEVRRGDLLVSAGVAHGIHHAAEVLSDRVETPDTIARRGVAVEAAGPGGYVEVLEVPFGGGAPRRVGRRLTDTMGRMLGGQRLFRDQLSEAIDLPRARRMNALAGPWLGWDASRAAILTAIGLAAGASEDDFATAVGAWQVANGFTEDGVLGPCTWSAMRPVVGAGPSTPCVNNVRFRATTGDVVDPDNCCVFCQVNATTRFPLGVGITLPVGRTGLNGMELRFTLSGHATGWEYDILRTRRRATHERTGGVWTRTTHNVMGTDDDNTHDDECFTPQGGQFLFVIDAPGLRGPLPLAPTGAETDSIYRASFAEWVIARNKSAGVGWTKISLPVAWHSQSWLTLNGAGMLDLDLTRSEIALGAVEERVIGSDPP